MKLRDIAHARTGDKGDTSIIMVAPYSREDFALLGETLTIGAVAEHFDASIADVSVHPLDHLGAYTVVVRHRLFGGVTRSPSVDPHGKTLSGHMLDLDVHGA
jgi:hypothetical protein